VKKRKKGVIIRKKKKHLSKRSRSCSTSKSSSRKRRSSSSSSSTDDGLRKKKKKSKRLKTSKKLKKLNKESKDDQLSSDEDIIGPLPSAMSNDNMKPLTKEEWEKQQSAVRKVYDEETGRNRLVRGDGEIIEEMVSYKQHKEINKAATLADGQDFKLKTGLRKLS